MTDDKDLRAAAVGVCRLWFTDNAPCDSQHVRKAMLELREAVDALAASATDGWKEEAQRYAQNADYWRERAEACEVARPAVPALDVGPQAGFTVERWIDSLHENVNGTVWTTKAELRAALAASATDEPKPQTYAERVRPRSFAASGRATGESSRPWYRATSATDEGPRLLTEAETARLAEALRRADYMNWTAQEVAEKIAGTVASLARPAALAASAPDEGFLVEVGERPPWTRPAVPALDVDGFIAALPGIHSINEVRFGELMVPVSAVRTHLVAALHSEEPTE